MNSYHIFFILGIVAQSFILLFPKWKKTDFIKLFFMFIAGSFGMLPFKHEISYDFDLHLVFSSIIAAFFLTATCASRFITHIGARTLIVLNALVLFIVCEQFGCSHLFFILLLIPTFATIINSFTNLDKHFGWQVFFYLWFCAMSVIIGVLHFLKGEILNISVSDFGMLQIPPVSAFFVGASFLYILSNIWYIFYMIPVPTSKRESFSVRIMKIKRHMQLLAHGYVRQKNDTLGNIIILIILPVILFVNYQYAFISSDMVIFFILTLIPLVSRFGLNSEESDDGIGSDLVHSGGIEKTTNKFDK